MSSSLCTSIIILLRTRYHYYLCITEYNSVDYSLPVLSDLLPCLLCPGTHVKGATGSCNITYLPTKPCGESTNTPAAPQHFALGRRVYTPTLRIGAQGIYPNTSHWGAGYIPQHLALGRRVYTPTPRTGAQGIYPNTSHWGTGYIPQHFALGLRVYTPTLRIGAQGIYPNTSHWGAGYIPQHFALGRRVYTPTPRTGAQGEGIYMYTNTSHRGTGYVP